MSKTIVVFGYGKGISVAVAERFGKEGFAVALVARNAERLDAGVKALAAKGVQAVAVQADVSDPVAARSAIERARTALGPICAIHWNAYSGVAGDLLTADAQAIRAELDVATTSLLAAVQAALPDLREADGPAVLVTNGGFASTDPEIDAAGVQFGAMGLSMANAAKNKLVGLLSAKLKGDGVYVGQVTVLGTVRGTAWDSGAATLEPSAIAEKFWTLYRERRDVRASIG